jgi:hypothetical protein
MNMKTTEARAIAKEAYIYGYPMVDNYRVRNRMGGRRASTCWYAVTARDH